MCIDPKGDFHFKTVGQFLLQELYPVGSASHFISEELFLGRHNWKVLVTLMGVFQLVFFGIRCHPQGTITAAMEESGFGIG